MKHSRFISQSFLQAFLLLLTLSSCSQDLLAPEEDANEQQEMSLVISTRMGDAGTLEGTAPENKVTSLRAIVFEGQQRADGSYQLTEQVANEYYSTDLTNRITIKFPKCDWVQVFLIANERNEWNLASKTKGADEIEQYLVSYTVSELAAPHQFLMFTKSNILTGRSNETGIALSLVRNLARVDLSLSCTFAEMTDLAPGGKLELSVARIYRMASASGLGAPVSVDISKDFLDGDEVLFTEGGNYHTHTSGGGDVTGFNSSISFYVPEYQIVDSQEYTYIYVMGNYHRPDGSSVKVAYTVPIGGGITTEKINSNKFGLADVTIERNTLYRLNGTFKSLKHISDIYASVLPWTEANIDGSINKPISAKLNVSDINPTLRINEQISIQFWSDQALADIRVLPRVTTSEGEEFDINEIFTDLTPIFVMNELDEWTRWGRLSLAFRAGMAKVNTVYKFTLVAGSLQRVISVTAMNETLEPIQ